MSRIGKRPIDIPKGVQAEIKDACVTVQGPKGKLSERIQPRIKVAVQGNQIVVTRPTDCNRDRALHGVTRSIIYNLVRGVSEGFNKELEIRGVGFRAQVSGKNLSLQLGFSHPVNFVIPEGIVIETPKPTQIIIKGIDKKLVGSVSAKIRSFYPPEPYKGKGIRYAGEYVRHKVGKAIA